MTGPEDELWAREAEAMRTHATLDGSQNLATLSAMSWGILRGLGVEGGRMLVVGADGRRSPGCRRSAGS